MHGFFICSSCPLLSLLLPLPLPLGIDLNLMSLHLAMQRANLHVKQGIGIAQEMGLDMELENLVHPGFALVVKWANFAYSKR